MRPSIYDTAHSIGEYVFLLMKDAGMESMEEQVMEELMTFITRELRQYERETRQRLIASITAPHSN